MPSRRHSSAIFSSPRRPSKTIRTFSSAEYFLRVRRRISRTVASTPAVVSSLIVYSLVSSILTRKSHLSFLPYCVSQVLTRNIYGVMTEKHIRYDKLESEQLCWIGLYLENCFFLNILNSQIQGRLLMSFRLTDCRWELCISVNRGQARQHPWQGIWLTISRVILTERYLYWIGRVQSRIQFLGLSRMNWEMKEKG